MERHSWWQGRIRHPDGSTDRLVVVQSSRHPDGCRVELDEAEAAAAHDGDLVCEAEFRADRVTHLRVARAFAPKAPPVWFAELAEPSAEPPALCLLAFPAEERSAGALRSGDLLAEADVVSADQLGAIRWWPGTGEIDQIYVSPQCRRQHLATVLLAAAGTLSVVRGWPRLWSDGERTQLGEDLRNARPWRDRAAELTHLAPPMTPTDPARATG